MVQRIILLLLVSFLVGLPKHLFEIDTSWISTQISWQSIILLVGGLFLLSKCTSEIHEKLEFPNHEIDELKNKKIKTLSGVLVQILLIDFIFSIDSILTAIGMTKGISDNPNDALMLMIIAAVVSIIVMEVFANAIRDFINKHPSMQLLALSFLILIGYMLLTEAAHLSNTSIFGQTIGAIPKGYLYFAIAFSLLIEFLNMRLRKKMIPKS